MKLNINYDKSSKIKFTVTAELNSKDLAKQKNKTVKNLSSGIKVPGFREGTAPTKLIEEKINPDSLARELTSNCIDVAFAAALKEFSLDLIGTPKLEIKKYIPDQEMTLEFIGNIKPEIKLPDFSKWAKSKLNVKVSADEISKTIEQLRENMAETIDVSRAAKNGDKVFLDFDGTDDKGKAIPGASSKNYPLVLGSRSFIPGFEEEVLGLKAGDKKDFKITFPKDYHSESLQNKKVTFKINIQKVTELKKPKLDAGFAKKLGDFSSVDELKDDIKKELTHRAEHQERTKLKDSLAEKLAKESKFETPGLLVDDNVEAGLANSKQDIASRGQNFEDFLKASGFKNEDEFIQKEVRPMAETQVRVGLSLRALADQQKIAVGSEEMQAYTAALLQQYQNPAAQAQINSPEEQARIEGRLLADKVLDYLLDKTS